MKPYDQSWMCWLHARKACAHCQRVYENMPNTLRDIFKHDYTAYYARVDDDRREHARNMEHALR